MRFMIVAENKETKAKMFVAVHPIDIDSYGNYKGVRYSWTTNFDEGEVFMVDIFKVCELWDNEIKKPVLSLLKPEYYSFYICTAMNKFAEDIVEYLPV